MKYKLTSEYKTVNGVTLHRIEVVKPFAGFNAGDKGGWVEKEANLSQEGSAWVRLFGQSKRPHGKATYAKQYAAALAMAKVCVKPYKEGKK